MIAASVKTPCPIQASRHRAKIPLHIIIAIHFVMFKVLTSASEPQRPVMTAQKRVPYAWKMTLDHG
jgi:hypothetical protein